MATATTMDIRASDTSGQHRVNVRGIKSDATVRELVKGLLAKMGLVQNDVSGQPLEYRALLEREGRHLFDAEIVGDALSPDDQITLTPKINAG
jgi:hypothetical protein